MTIKHNSNILKKNIYYFYAIELIDTANRDNFDFDVTWKGY